MYLAKNFRNKSHFYTPYLANFVKGRIEVENILFTDTFLIFIIVSRIRAGFNRSPKTFNNTQKKGTYMAVKMIK